MLNKYKKVRKILKHDIEPEDLFLDSEVASRHNSISDFKIEFEFPVLTMKSLLALFLLVFFILSFKIYNLNFARNNKNKERALANVSRIYQVKSVRGIIYDKNKKQLVFNEPTFDILITPKDFNQDLDKSLSELIADGDVSIKEKVDEILDNLDYDSSNPVLLASSADLKKILFLKDKLINFEGIKVDLSSRRRYLEGAGLAHILGYIGRISKEDKNRDKDSYINDYIGKSGLELFYNKELRGQNGRRVIEVDASTSFKREKVLTQPSSGNNLILNIDFDAQKKLYELLSEKIKESGIYGGAAVLVEASTGRILSLVSVPDYDNNIFTNFNSKSLNLDNQDGGIEQKLILKIFSDKKNPLFNRAISGEYFPGSTIKPLIASAGLQEGIITKDTKINSSENIKIVSRYDSSVIYQFRDWADHGIVNLRKALAVSSNIFFFTIGGGYKNFQGLGVDSIDHYLSLFNLGKLSNIDLPGEKAGVVPSPIWKEKIFKERWFIGDTYNLATGQAMITTTPLQMTMAIASIINGGKIFKPFLVDKIVDSNSKVIKNFESVLVNTIPIDQSNFESIKEGMKDVAQYGTGRVLNSLTFAVGAKTGTADLGGINRSWTISFAPYDNPRFVLGILIDGGLGGGTTAAPVVRDFFEWYKLKLGGRW
ncbi:penicillin-binding protein 2 [Candidatus Azambacteria bacterium]|nr:penicillin-binding protein 2 [Candidatus Azambacteria bacterium]